MRERHPYTPSDLQAFVDGEGSWEQRSALQAHLAGCSRCRRKLNEIVQTTRFVEERLAGDRPPRTSLPRAGEIFLSAVEPDDPDAAWRRFLDRVAGTPISPVWNGQPKPAQAEADRGTEASGARKSNFAKERKDAAAAEHPAAYPGRTARLRIRRAVALRTAAAAAGTILLIGTFATDLGNRALAAMLHTLRMEHLVGVGEDDLAEISRTLEQAEPGTIDLRQYGKIEHSGGGPAKEFTAAEAFRAVGYPAKVLPGSDPARSPVQVQPGQTITLYLKADKVNALIRRMGGRAQLPSSVDGQPIAVTIPAVVTQWEHPHGGDNRWRELVQLRTPQLEVPPQVDIEAVRRVLTDLPFVPNEIRQRIAGTEDWKKTLFVPLPGQVRNLSIEGREAVLSSSEHTRTLLWLDGGYLYLLSGSAATYPSDEAILREAKEIMNS